MRKFWYAIAFTLAIGAVVAGLAIGKTDLFASPHAAHRAALAPAWQHAAVAEGAAGSGVDDAVCNPLKAALRAAQRAGIGNFGVGYEDISAGLTEKLSGTIEKDLDSAVTVENAVNNKKAQDIALVAVSAATSRFEVAIGARSPAVTQWNQFLINRDQVAAEVSCPA
jgi:hypothetical protein